MTTLRSGPGKTLLVASVMAVLAVLFPRTAAAQTVTGTISGTITDPQGQVIPGATVTVVNESTNDSRVTVSDANGNFQVTNLQPGRYTVRVALQSFRTLERKNIVLSAGRAAGGRHSRAGGRRHRRDRRRRGEEARTSTPRKRSTAASSPPRRLSRSRSSAVT